MSPDYTHPLPLRIWHWVNCGVVIALIATGGYLRLYGIATVAETDKPDTVFVPHTTVSEQWVSKRQAVAKRAGKSEL